MIDSRGSGERGYRSYASLLSDQFRVHFRFSSAFFRNCAGREGGVIYTYTGDDFNTFSGSPH